MKRMGYECLAERGKQDDAESAKRAVTLSSLLVRPAMNN